MTNIDNELIRLRKFKEFQMKITKMSGYLADYYIDRAIESDDYSDISSYLIDYFESYDIGYLVSKYKEFGLNEKIEDFDFDISEWYKVRDSKEILSNWSETKNMDEEEYIQYMIEKRKNEIDE